MRTILTLALLALTAASAFAQTTFTVEGTVTSQESGAALAGVAVSLWRGDSDFAATSTDAGGRYALQVTVTSAENPEQPAETFALGPVYPNPGRDRFNVGIETTEAGRYAFSVVDVLGRRLIQSSMELGAGRHQAQLSGLPAGGLYVLHVEGPASSRSTAFTATAGGGFPSISLEQAGTRSLSLAATASSDYTLRFEKSGFYDESFPIETEDTTLDVQLEAVRYGTAVYAVTVRNERFDHAVRNALVTIWDAEADSLLGHHFTDAEGNATVEYPHPLHRDGTSRLTSIEAAVERDGYEPWRETLDFKPSITREVDLPWIPQYVSATYDLEFLNHMLKTPVKDATVRIHDQTGANIYAQGQTNADGRITRTVSVERGPNGQLLEDYLTLTAQRPGYENLESTLEIKPEETHQATIDLEKQPQVNSFNINAFNIHGDPVDDQTTFYFDVGKGQVYAFNPQNGLLAVMISDYADEPSEDVKVYHDHPEHLYNDITVFRARNAKWHEDPMNNNITHEWMPGQPFDTLSVPKSHLIHIANQSEIDLYTAPRTFNHPHRGELRMNEDTILRLMFARNDGELYKWQPYNFNGEMINHVDVVVQGWNETTGVPETEDSINKLKSMMQYVLDQYTLNNGVELLNYKLHIAHTPQDSIRQVITDRLANNTIITRRRNGPPSNGVTLEVQDRRIRHANSNTAYPTSINTELEETSEGTTTIEDAPVQGATISYIGKGDGLMNDLGRMMLQFMANARRGTKIHYNN